LTYGEDEDKGRWPEDPHEGFEGVVTLRLLSREDQSQIPWSATEEK
jgi:hypothetical protein